MKWGSTERQLSYGTLVCILISVPAITSLISCQGTYINSLISCVNFTHACRIADVEDALLQSMYNLRLQAAFC